MNDTSKTDWARIDAMGDEEIDTSDIPPLSEPVYKVDRTQTIQTFEAFPSF